MNKKLSKIKICITDDHLLFAEGISSILSNEVDMQVVGIANQKSELFEFLDHVKVDVVLLDIKLPDGNGIEIIKSIKNKNEQIKVVMISTFSDIKSINNCINNNADAFLIKNCSKETLCETIRGVTEGRKFFQESLENQYSKSKFVHISLIYKITKREWQIMELIKNGKTNIQISAELNISNHTTETHRKNIMQKLGLKNQNSLLLFLVNEI